MASSSQSAPPKYARVRPSNDGNPLITRRRPPRPVRAPRAPASTDHLSLKALEWASASAMAIQKESEANTINNTEWVSYKLTTTKASLLKTLRHHVIRLHPKRYEEVSDPTNPAETVSIPRKVDLLDPAEFARPVRLHRRDPCAPLGGVKEAGAARLIAAQQSPVYDEEKEARDAERAQKAAGKAEIASKIAPYGAAGVKKNRFTKKTEQVFRHDQSNAQMRYEESQPWFIEDFDNGNTWQGQREQNLSGGKFVALVYGKNSNSFNMIPIEKWYKFREVNKFKMTPEEAVERKRQLDGKTPPWIKVEKVVEVEVDEHLTAEEARLYQKYSRLVVKDVVTSKGSEEARATAELEEMDYDQEFDNDDSGQLYGADGDDNEEEQKDIEKRIKKEQLTANNGLRTGGAYDEDSTTKVEIAAAARSHGKKTRQFLRKREGNNNYDSDSDSNPYASSHEEDEGEIAARAKAVKIEVAARLKADANKKAVEVVLEFKKAADVAEKKAKAAEKRREIADKKKAAKAPGAGEFSPVVSAGLTVLGKKDKRILTATVTPTRKTMVGPSGSNKRTLGHIAGFDSGSDSNPVGKKPRKHAKASKNTIKPEVTVDITPLSPSAAKGVTHKRKPEILSGELQTKKKQRVDHPAHSLSPAIIRQADAAPNPRPITDEELKAVLRHHPDGVTMKGITEAFKGRMTKSSEDIRAMVASMKRVGKVGPVKGKYVLKDGLV